MNNLIGSSIIRIVAGRLTETSTALLFPLSSLLLHNSVWVLLLDRLQQRMDLVQIPVTDFGGNSTNTKLVLQERSQSWINVTEAFHFLKDGRLLWTSEKTGYRHLCLLDNGKETQLTQGEWQVRADHLIQLGASHT